MIAHKDDLEPGKEVSSNHLKRTGGCLNRVRHGEGTNVNDAAKISLGRFAIEKVLAVCENIKAIGPEKWAVTCWNPGHDDQHPSLQITIGDDGRILGYCHVCRMRLGDMVAHKGLTEADLFSSPPPRGSRPRSKKVYPTLEAVTETIVRQRGGQFGGRWPYHYADGRESFHVVRVDLPNGKKACSPVHHNGQGFVQADPPGKLVLYRLRELNGADRVYVVEGEKCADAAAAIGLMATTSAHGAGAAHKSDWSPLAGREVIILPDNDPSGQQYADDVANILTSLDLPATVKVVELPNLGEGEDIVEYVGQFECREDADIRRGIDEMADQAPEWKPEPIGAESPSTTVLAPRAFPTHALPSPVCDFIRRAADAIGCDESYVALPLLAAMAAAIGNTRRVRLKRGWLEPPTIWGAIVGESGTAKSPAIDAALQFLRFRQDEAFRRYEIEMKRFEEQDLCFQRDLANWKKGSQGESDRPPEKPDPPQAVRCICADTTIEGLFPILKANPRGVLVDRDELSGWLGSFDQYKSGGKGTDAPNWLELHRAGRVTVDRKSQNEPVHLSAATVSLIGGIQPEILQMYLGRRHVADGLAARLLFAMPPRKPKTWTERDVEPGLANRMQTLFDGLLELDFERNTNGLPVPVELALTQSANGLWVPFYNDLNRRLASYPEPLAAAMAKLEAYGARFGLIIHLIRVTFGDPALADPARIDERSISAGIELVEWFAWEARRVYSAIGQLEDMQDQGQFVEMIRRKGGGVTVREWQRARSLGTSKEAKAELERLRQAGLGQWEHPASGPAGGRPSEKFRVHDGTDTDKTPYDGS